MYKNLLLALAINLAVPVAGLYVSNRIINDIESKLKFDPLLACQIADRENITEMKSVCELVENLSLLKKVSIGAGASSIGLIFLYVFAALICGRNRFLNATIFPPLIPITTFIISILVLSGGGIITYSAYISESWYFGRIHYVLIGGIGLGAVIGCLALITSILSIEKDINLSEFGEIIEREDEPSLWGFVDSIAKDLDSTPPDNIIVGLQPTFYATAARVFVKDKKKTLFYERKKHLEGETLFISLPLMRLFNKDELKSVIAHELGHFRGDDTYYTMKFAPIYRGLNQSLLELDKIESAMGRLAAIPAISMLSFMISIFSINERRISRDREFEADKAAVSVTSSDVFATALGKVSIFSGLWSHVRQKNIKRLNEGKISPNLSLIFEDSSRYDISNENIDNILKKVLETRVSHPTDTHPTTFERFEKIKFDYKKLEVEDLIKKGNSSVTLVKNLDSMEEYLTLEEHRLMIGLGYANVPEDVEPESAHFLNAIYTLAAGMVCADGIILPEEINTAEDIGMSLFDNFDSVDFRAYCNNYDEIPHFDDVVDAFGESFDTAKKKTLYDYLHKIAISDNDFAEEEQQLLKDLSKKWKLKLNE